MNIMKKALFMLFAIMLTASMVFSQAKKPTLMVVPSDVWCNQNGYMMEFDDQGSVIKIPNYKMAMQEDADLLLVISTINGLMAERDFPLKNLESALKSLESDAAEDNMMMSKSGSEVQETPIDALKKVAKADIIIQITWTINKTGPKKSVTFNMQGLDAYTDKQIATATGTGPPSFSVELPVLLEEAVLSHIDNFNASLMTHFEDMFANGREVIIRIRTWDDWEYDLESEFGPEMEELGFIIEDWLFENTVQGRFNTTDATESMMLFEQVRIPMYFERNGRQYAMDTRRFARNLSSFLKKEPYNIVNKITTKGLGRATLYLGSK
jgi:hypothetical protein